MGKPRVTYPDAEIVTASQDASGALPRGLQCRVNDDPYHDEVDEVCEIANRVWIRLLQVADGAAPEEG